VARQAAGTMFTGLMLVAPLTVFAGGILLTKRPE
jgi:hypothetical protein